LTDAAGTGSVSAKATIFDSELTFSSMSTLDRSASLNILASEKILGCIAQNTGSITSITENNQMFTTAWGSPNDENAKYDDPMKEVGMLYQLFSSNVSDNDLVGAIVGLSKAKWVIPTDTDAG